MPCTISLGDGGRVLAARIVVGDHDRDRRAARRRAHLRALAADRGRRRSRTRTRARARRRPRGRSAVEHLFERIGRVRVVDHDQRLAARRPVVACVPAAARAARSDSIAASSVDAAREQHAEHAEEILRIECTDQRAASASPVPHGVPTAKRDAVCASHRQCACRRCPPRRSRSVSDLRPVSRAASMQALPEGVVGVDHGDAQARAT